MSDFAPDSAWLHVVLEFPLDALAARQLGGAIRQAVLQKPPARRALARPR